MKIAIDISQIAYEGTGVSRYVRDMVHELAINSNHEFILFASSFSKRSIFVNYVNSLQAVSSRVKLILFPFPIRLVEVLWNVLGFIPVDWIIGKVDIFWSSDWTQPPLSYAKGVTTIHDLTVFRFPESFSDEIVRVHKRKLKKSKKICVAFFCDSEATKKDAIKYLGIAESRLFVIYPGFSL